MTEPDLPATLRREFERLKAANPGWPAMLSVRSKENVIMITFVPPHSPVYIVISDGDRGYVAHGPEVISKHEGRAAAISLRASDGMTTK